MSDPDTRKAHVAVTDRETGMRIVISGDRDAFDREKASHVLSDALKELQE